MLPSQYIDGLDALGVTLTVLVRRGKPVGICHSLGAYENPDAVQKLMGEWIACKGDETALGAALMRRGRALQIDT